MRCEQYNQPNQHEDSILEHVIQKTQAIPSTSFRSSLAKQKKLLCAGKTRRLADVLLEDGHINAEDLSKLLNLEGIIAGYTILENVGQGRFGIVYKARQHSMDRIVAIKVLNPSLAKEEPYIGRFLRESHALGKLDHPNIIRGLDSGETQGIYYLVMDYFDGIQLDEYIKGNGRLSEERTLQIAKQLLSALEHTWDKKLLHRDISPGNIMIAQSQVKLCDFGLAKALAGSGGHTYRIPVRSRDYTAPELTMGGALSFTSDCFSLGGILYFCLTGDSPFEKIDNAGDYSTRRPYPIREYCPEISEETEKMILQLMENSPQKRCKSVENLKTRVDNIIKHQQNLASSKNSLDFWILTVGVCLIAYLAISSLNRNVRKTFTAKAINQRTKLSASQIYNSRSHSVVLIKSKETLGSGVLISYHNKILVITNAHVVQQNNITIESKDGKEYKGKILVCDTVADIAIVSVPIRDKEAAIVPFGKQDQVVVGQDVFAIGHPKGYRWSLTRGTVSGIRGYTIQTDAAINPGNSGGPLLNAHGELVGINTFIIGKTNNIGFAISIGRILDFLGKAANRGII